MKKLTLFYFVIIVTFSSAITIFADATVSPAAPIAASQDADNNVAPCADITGWKYKTINGYLCKRLYNYTTGEWIGGWIRC